MVPFANKTKENIILMSITMSGFLKSHYQKPFLPHLLRHLFYTFLFAIMIALSFKVMMNKSFWDSLRREKCCCSTIRSVGNRSGKMSAHERPVIEHKVTTEVTDLKRGV